MNEEDFVSYRDFCESNSQYYFTFLLKGSYEIEDINYYYDLKEKKLSLYLKDNIINYNIKKLIKEDILIENKEIDFKNNVLSIKLTKK